MFIGSVLEVTKKSVPSNPEGESNFSSNLNREVSHLDVSKRQALDALGRDELDTADSDYATDSICWLGDDSQSGDFINCEHRGGRAGIEENLSSTSSSAPLEIGASRFLRPCPQLPLGGAK